VRWQTLLIDPPVHRIADHAKVADDFLDRNPPLAGSVRPFPGLILHESAIVSKNRNERNRHRVLYEERWLDPMSFQQKTLNLARQRVCELCAGFNAHISAFEAENLFTGPSLYFRHKTLAIRRDLGCSADACLKSEHFFESLYATLASWGLHRMGPGKTKLVDLPVMVRGFQGQTENLKKLAQVAIQDLSPQAVLHTADQIWKVIWTALHHLLPDLVPPIDREYTVQFFFNNKNAIQGDEAKQREAFLLMYPSFARVCQERKTEIESCLGRAMNTSCTKVVDNAIVGDGRTVLKIHGETAEDSAE
jgi:hypothetical protein